MAASNTKINQAPQTLFVTETIQDPSVRYNFDILNRELASRRTLRQPPAANFVVSNQWPTLDSSPGSWSTTVEQQPGALAVTITTRGNPVVLKLASIQYTKGGRFLPQFYMVNSAGTAVGVQGGFYRSSATLSPTVISRHYVSAQIGSAAFVRLAIPFQTFDFTDYNVPSGTWRYQFYLQNDATTNYVLYRACVQAYELR